MGSNDVKHTFETIAWLFGSTLKLSAGLLSALPTEGEEGWQNIIVYYTTYLKAR